MNGYLIALILLIAFYLGIFILYKTGLMERYKLSMMGPLLMWRTQKGKEVINRLSRKRGWFTYAKISKIIVAAAMISMFFLLIWEATIVPSIPKENAPSPEMMLGIPGINRAIPLSYGILGLVVAIVFHEGAHGVLTRANNLKVKSLGILLMVVPLGAFVEPDEDELQSTTKKKRSDVFAVGPGTNIIVAIVVVIIFTGLMMPSVVPVHEGAVITDVMENGPAHHAGIDAGEEILQIGGPGGGTKIDSIQSINSVNAEPGLPVPITVFTGKGEPVIKNCTAGLAILKVSAGAPAQDAGLVPGMIIYSINDTVIHNYTEFNDVISRLKVGVAVNMSVYSYSSTIPGYAQNHSVSTITPTDRYEYYSSAYAPYAHEEDRGKAFLGISVSYMGLNLMDVRTIPEIYSHPFRGAEGIHGYVMAGLGYLALPFYHLSPVEPPLSNMYTITGVCGALPSGAFWVLANSLYWIFWINIMVGLTNALPAIPLDGGYLLMDWADSILSRLKKNSTKEGREKAISVIMYILSFSVLGLILWQMIGPRLL